MELTANRDHLRHVTTFVLELTDKDYVTAELDGLDQELLRLAGEDEAPVSEKLRALAMLAFRVEEAHEALMEERLKSMWDL